MSRPSRAEHWPHTAWTYRGRALIHPTQAAALTIPIAIGVLALSVTATVICFLVCELTVLLVAPHVAGFRRSVEESFLADARLRAAAIRATLLSRMEPGYRYELERLEELVARVRDVTGHDAREADDWLGLDSLIAVYVRLAIAHRDSTAAFDAGVTKRLEAQIVELIATANMVEDVGGWGARRLAILHARLEASWQARNEQALLQAQLATIAETIQWAFEQAALGWSSDAQVGVEDAVAHFAGNGAALRELATLRGQAPIDAEALRLGRQGPRVELVRLPYLAEPLTGRLLVDEPVDPTCCSAALARQHSPPSIA